MTIYQRLEPLQTFWFDRESMYMMGFGSFWGQTGWPCSKHESQRQKILRSSWNWNLVKPNLSLLWHSSLPNLPNGIVSWFQQPYVMATLRMSRRSGQIGLKRCVHLTDRIANFVTWMVANCCINWHLTVAKCAKCAVPSGLSQRLCCNKRAVRICVAGCFNWREVDPALVSVTLHSHITLSPVTCHPIQCRANMRVADCATVWVCKCLQLIYLSALHLTLFDIYKIYGKI